MNALTNSRTSAQASTGRSRSKVAGDVQEVGA